MKTDAELILSLRKEIADNFTELRALKADRDAVLSSYNVLLRDYGLLEKKFDRNNERLNYMQDKMVDIYTRRNSISRFVAWSLVGIFALLVLTQSL